MLRRARFLCARGALVAEGVKACACSSPAPTACSTVEFFRALPLDVCV